MTTLTQAAYLRHLAADTRRFLEVLAHLDPATPVASCPGWTAADLLWHLAEVQWFWAGMVRDRPASPAEDRGYPPRPETRDEMLAALERYSADLRHELAAARPDEAAWSWVANRTVGFTLRRQSHEALIHRVDAEQAAGARTSIDPRLAADGVLEALDVLYGRVPAWGTVHLHEQVARVDCTDTGDRFWVRTGRIEGVDPADGVSLDVPAIRVVGPQDRPPDAVISGTAAELDLWLWHRDRGSGLAVRGDEEVHAHLVAVSARSV